MADKCYWATPVVPPLLLPLLLVLLPVLVLLLLLLLPLLVSRISSHTVHCAPCSTLLVLQCNQLCLTQSVQHSVSCLQVNIKRVLGLPYGHGTADLVRVRTASVKPSTEEVCAEYAGQRHLLLHDVQIQGETDDEQQASELWFEQDSRQTRATCSVIAVLLKHMSAMVQLLLMQHMRTACCC